MAPDPRPNDTSDFAATSALILFVAFVALVLAAGYIGHIMAGQ
ncbi:hypothetical protein [Hyphomicrobium sp. CS1GBMeth3]|nr:hypothetical protein [Hyphomicrobium sp. CS1GBMeth3]